MSDLLSIYNIEITSDPFSAAFITTPIDDLPSECQLPAPPTIPILTPISITMPTLACNYQIDVPIIPPPYFCSPGITADVAIRSCTGPLALTVNTDTAFEFAISGECDWNLDGAVTICLPKCIPSISGGISIGNSCTVVGTNPVQVNTTTPVAITYDADTCAYTLVGDIEICAPCIPTLSFDANVTTTNGGCTSTAGATGAFTFSGNPCNPSIGGTININIPHPPAPLDISIGSIDISVSGSGDGGVTVSGDGTLSLTASSGGSSCAPTAGITGSGSISVNLTGTVPGTDYQCEDPGDDTTKANILNIQELHTSLIDFNNTCCMVNTSYWKDCGSTMHIYGDGNDGVAALEISGNTSGGDASIKLFGNSGLGNQISIESHGSDLIIQLGDASSALSNTATAIIISIADVRSYIAASTSSYALIKFREVELCDGTYMMVLGSDVYSKS